MVNMDYWFLLELSSNPGKRNKINTINESRNSSHFICKYSSSYSMRSMSCGLTMDINTDFSSDEQVSDRAYG